MTLTSTTYHEEAVDLAGTSVQLLKGGSGLPLLVLHGFEGPEGWLAFYEALAQQATVYAPTHPGFTGTARPAWLESVQHMATFYGWFLQTLGLAQVDVAGCGLGGWIGAELAAQSPQAIRRLVLVDAAGIRPSHTETLDVFTTSWRQVIERSFFDRASCDEYQRIYGENPIVDFGGTREAGRSMTMRMAYRPYMHDPALKYKLGRVNVPTLIVWGAEDQIIPPECGELYRDAIPGAQLRTIEGCGHMAHWEKPDELAKLVNEFCK
jgi:pimeloyl-ACP methyl ester carboxylesterase